MAKENESASQATVNGDNALTRSTMSSIGIGRGCVLLRETHGECTRYRWCCPHSWRDDRLVLIMSLLGATEEPLGLSYSNRSYLMWRQWVTHCLSLPALQVAPQHRDKYDFFALQAPKYSKEFFMGSWTHPICNLGLILLTFSYHKLR
ncbi:PREDICTED: uncharacterized protein LOC103341313 isoform X1 [Prunus mume]|uniref:Uncharacterized protein LOC103341313 isoform X1 n=1 Tax=Prunus mume TaxID=102107 RepID=A0ABM0PQP7_PRUMU|nr:PREDICTED: uncharacterized protein LOC103341313 isoform X1 [Prunus mume]